MQIRRRLVPTLAATQEKFESVSVKSGLLKNFKRPIKNRIIFVKFKRSTSHEITKAHLSIHILDKSNMVRRSNMVRQSL